ncbi:MAG: cytochrome c maturation protein CcmE [Calditrichaeota bacterium]|nr:MAG: cytochrome c maturation protein CcmE [Calditrichota bacterium]
MQRKVKIYFAFAMVVAALAFLITSGFNNETMVYYSTVKELKAKGANGYNQGYRVSGVAKAGSIRHDVEKVQVEFDIEEEGETLHIVYNGILPDTFKEGSEVLVEGKYSHDGNFYATNVFTKCASKYDAAEMQKR